MLPVAETLEIYLAGVSEIIYEGKEERGAESKGETSELSNGHRTSRSQTIHTLTRCQCSTELRW